MKKFYDWFGMSEDLIKKEEKEKDYSGLMTVARYASEVGVGRATVYNMIKDGRVEGEEIDGVQFVRPLKVGEQNVLKVKSCLRL